MKKLPRERIRLAFEKKRIDDELGALLNRVAPELDAAVREKFRDDPVRLAEWEAERELMRPDPPRPKAKRAATPKKDET